MPTFSAAALALAKTASAMNLSELPSLRLFGVSRDRCCAFNPAKNLAVPSSTAG